MVETYQTFILELECPVIEYEYTDDNVYKISSNKCLPLCSVGYNHNLLQSITTFTNIISKLDKKDFIYVVNPFEINIDNYDKTLINITKHFFNNDEIYDNIFFKFWDIFNIFSLLENKQSNIAIMSAKSTGIIQAIIQYKKLYLFNNDDKIYNISDDDILLNIPPNLVKNHKSKYDITHLKTIISFNKEIEKSYKKADIIIGDSGYDNENEIYRIIISEILLALKSQALNGHFILKIYDTYTIVTIKLIYVLSSFYKNAYIYKPYYSRNNNSEKYIIFMHFKYNTIDKTVHTILQSLELLLIDTKHQNIYDIFLNINIPEEYLNIFTFINIKLANEQQILINKIIKYIRENNYFGDKYHMYKENQIKATQWWATYFLSNDVTEIKDRMTNLLKTYALEYYKFQSLLIKNKF